MTTEAKTPAVFDDLGMLWEKMVDEMLARSRHIIALRGAGSFNGITIAAADNMLKRTLIPRVSAYLRDGRVSIIYDGDNDDPNYPDVGHIMGRLRDAFGDGPVDWYAVQKWNWYKYQYNDVPAGIEPELKPLHSANGGEYRTVLFSEKQFAGEHNWFSQHERLVRSPAYEQWYVGACGLIASEQLADYSAKAEGVPGLHKAVIFRAAVSIEQGRKIRTKLREATDPEVIKRLQDSIARRAANLYGLLCTPKGEFISKPEYANLTIELA